MQTVKCTRIKAQYASQCRSRNVNSFSFFVACLVWFGRAPNSQLVRALKNSRHLHFFLLLVEQKSNLKQLFFNIIMHVFKVFKIQAVLHCELFRKCDYFEVSVLNKIQVKKSFQKVVW